MRSNIPAAADIAIVGAGAAGLMAGIWAGRTAANQGRRPQIVLLEGSSKLGRKILISGGGRCNLTHQVVTPADYAGSSRNAIKKVLKRFDVPATVKFFNELGVHFKTEETGKLFPTTDRAQTVLNALVREAQTYADIYHPCRVESIVRCQSTGGFELLGDWGSLRARSVVLATGGKSIPKTGSDGHGFELAKSLGHSLTPQLFPALVPLTLTKDHFIRDLSGMTLVTALELWGPTGKRLERFENSTLCTHFGLSGPAALDVSRYYLAAVKDDPNVSLTINWAPAWNENSLGEQLRSESQRRPYAILREQVPDRLAKALLDCWQADPDVPPHAPETVACQLSKKAIRSLARIVTRMPLPITGTRGFDFAEATAGGVPLQEIQLQRMESRVCPGLHFCGEICDVDGRIGGFNFQWAWASGYVVGVALGDSPVSSERAPFNSPQPPSLDVT
ncbi:MAG: NAD(P)/FAD-dependent oxidoreductase [Planctomycetales bacterium]|nr:NAD(P)/FAD-dependent oxidoreductase [Planctomycetales bacterium]